MPIKSLLIYMPLVNLACFALADILVVVEMSVPVVEDIWLLSVFKSDLRQYKYLHCNSNCCKKIKTRNFYEYID